MRGLYLEKKNKQQQQQQQQTTNIKHKTKDTQKISCQTHLLFTFIYLQGHAQDLNLIV